MAHEEFGRFRQEIRSWMDSHPDEYDAFVVPGLGSTKKAVAPLLAIVKSTRI